MKPVQMDADLYDLGYLTTQPRRLAMSRTQKLTSISGLGLLISLILIGTIIVAGQKFPIEFEPSTSGSPNGKDPRVECTIKVVIEFTINAGETVIQTGSAEIQKAIVAAERTFSPEATIEMALKSASNRGYINNAQVKHLTEKGGIQSLIIEGNDLLPGTPENLSKASDDAIFFFKNTEGKFVFGTKMENLIQYKVYDRVPFSGNKKATEGIFGHLMRSDDGVIPKTVEEAEFFKGTPFEEKC